MPIQSRNIPRLAKIFRAMGSRTRLRILMQLQKGPQNVTAVVKKLKIPQPTVSHHLSILREASLVTANRQGKQVIYSLNDAQVQSEKMLKATCEKGAGIKFGPLVFGAVKR